SRQAARQRYSQGGRRRGRRSGSEIVERLVMFLPQCVDERLDISETFGGLPFQRFHHDALHTRRDQIWHLLTQWRGRRVNFLESNLQRRPEKWGLSTEQLINKYTERILIAGTTTVSLNLFRRSVDHSFMLRRFHTSKA